MVESIQSIHNGLWMHYVINALFIMLSSTSAWLLSPLECSPQKQNGWTLRFCFRGWIMWKMYNKTIIEFGFRMIYRDYFMESACVRDFHTSWCSIWNRTSERSERVRFLIQNQRVWKSRTKRFPCCNLFISYILRFLLFLQL